MPISDLTGDGIPDYDITGATASVTIDDVIFTRAGNLGSGTGNYNTFLAISPTASQHDGFEAGFNSDDTPPLDSTNNEIDQSKTHTVLLSSLVQVTVDGVQYYQIRLDLNEDNSGLNPQISLDQFKLYASTDGGIESTTDLFDPAQTDLIYDMDASGNVSVLLSDFTSSGSGTDDYSFLIPVDKFVDGNGDPLDPATTYIYLYADMGEAGTNWTADATFEEWNLENGVTLCGTKFNDINGNGIQDTGEGGVEGITVFIDANHNGDLDTGERFTITDENGEYCFYGVAFPGAHEDDITLWIDEVVPDGAIQTTGDHEEVVLTSGETPGSVITVDPIGNFIPNPDIDIIKKTNGFNDTCPTLLTGTTVTWTYEVTNTGNVGFAEADISVTDDQGVTPVYDSGDDGNNILDPGETWIYVATGTVVQGPYENTGTVTADWSVSLDGSSLSGTETDDDDDCYTGVTPDIDIVKTTNGTDGECNTILVGETVTWDYAVTNTGDIDLTNVVITDDNGTPDDGNAGNGDETLDDFNPTYVSGDDGDGILNPGETWYYQATDTAAAGDYTNTATVSGDATDDSSNTQTVNADDDDCYNGVTPTIDIVKTTNGTDDQCPVVLVGDTVTWDYAITNTGDIDLTNVVVTDDNGTPDDGNAGNGDETLDDFNPTYVSGDDGDGILNPGETWYYQATGTAVAGHYTNIAEVSGDATDDSSNTQTVTASEDDCYMGIQEGSCVRTPGFWSNWGSFWNGVSGDEPKQSGQPDFPSYDLLRIDSNGDGVIDGNDSGFSSYNGTVGLLIGDYDRDGVQDVGEDIFFISLSDAQSLINASNKSMSDGVIKIGRDLVATWLNYLNGTNVGDASDTGSPHHYIDDAIDWMQVYGGKNTSNTDESFDSYKSNHTKVTTSSAAWIGTPIAWIDHSGAQIHNALDEYNNFGTVNGSPYANSCDNDPLVALAVDAFDTTGFLYA